MSLPTLHSNNTAVITTDYNYQVTCEVGDLVVVIVTGNLSIGAGTLLDSFTFNAYTVNLYSFIATNTNQSFDVYTSQVGRVISFVFRNGLGVPTFGFAGGNSLAPHVDVDQITAQASTAFVTYAFGDSPVNVTGAIDAVYEQATFSAYVDDSGTINRDNTGFEFQTSTSQDWLAGYFTVSGDASDFELKGLVAGGNADNQAAFTNVVIPSAEFGSTNNAKLSASNVMTGGLAFAGGVYRQHFATFESGIEIDANTSNNLSTNVAFESGALFGGSNAGKLTETMLGGVVFGGNNETSIRITRQCRLRLKAGVVDSDVGYMYVPVYLQLNADTPLPDPFTAYEFFTIEGDNIPHLIRSTKANQIRAMVYLRPNPTEDFEFIVQVG